MKATYAAYECFPSGVDVSCFRRLVSARNAPENVRYLTGTTVARSGAGMAAVVARDRGTLGDIRSQLIQRRCSEEENNCRRLICARKSKLAVAQNWVRGTDTHHFSAFPKHVRAGDTNTLPVRQETKHAPCGARHNTLERWLEWPHCAVKESQCRTCCQTT